MPNLKPWKDGSETICGIVYGTMAKPKIRAWINYYGKIKRNSLKPVFSLAIRLSINLRMTASQEPYELRDSRTVL